VASFAEFVIPRSWYAAAIKKFRELVP